MTMCPNLTCRPQDHNRRSRDRRNRDRRSRSRRGAVLVLAIVCVAVAMSIMALVVRFAVLRHAVQKNQLLAAQANWLVESALDRAAARLALDPAYTGETWDIPAAEFQTSETTPLGNAATVRIEVKSFADRPDDRVIMAAADYPVNTHHRARRSKQIAVTLAAPTTN